MFSNLEKKKFQITISTKIQALWGIGIDIFCKTSATEMPIPIFSKHKKKHSLGTSRKGLFDNLMICTGERKRWSESRRLLGRPTRGWYRFCQTQKLYQRNVKWFSFWQLTVNPHCYNNLQQWPNIFNATVLK